MSKNKKAGTSKSIFLRIALLCFAVYTIYSMVVLQNELISSRRILEQKKQQISARQISNEELENLLKSGSEKDLIEKAAREKLDYVYANEEVYKDISGK